MTSPQQRNGSIIYATSVLQSRTSLDKGKIFTYRGDAPWFDRLSEILDNWRYFVRSKAVEAFLVVPNIASAVALWLKDELLPQNLPIMNQHLNSAQKIINRRIQTNLDTVFESGDAYLHALNEFVNPHISEAQMVLAGVSRANARAESRRLVELALPVAEDAWWTLKAKDEQIGCEKEYVPFARQITAYLRAARATKAETIHRRREVSRRRRQNEKKSSYAFA